MLELEASPEIDPICAHCSTPLRKLLYQELRGMLGRRFIYYCSHCHKVLGVSHRKGFWMG
ncbi:MAG: hypothetical protein JSW71_04735 [Gemmatimonadota bacterium]|nr:MAG: hypothetical protein JSW71_04735 [Gemmatimonadota bacterium]